MGQPWLRKLVLVLPLALGFATTGLLSAKMLLIDGKPLHLSVDETAPYRGQAEYRLASQGEHWEDYYRAGGLAAECREQMLICRASEAGSRLQVWNVSGAHPAHLRLPLFAFPAWQVTIDGAAVPTASDPATGLISVDLPAGAHRVAATWKRLGVGARRSRHHRSRGACPRHPRLEAGIVGFGSLDPAIRLNSRSARTTTDAQL